MALVFPQYFTLEEMTQSDTAARLGLDNVPRGVTLVCLHETAENMMKVRELLGDKPISVHSGYRSPQVNAHIPGSSDTSAHTLGWAVDFTCREFGTPVQIAKRIATSDLMEEVDQLIHEYDSWVHISFDPRRRRELLTINKHGTQLGLH